MLMILGKYTVTVLVLVIMVLLAFLVGCSSTPTLQEYQELCRGKVQSYVHGTKYDAARVECK